jgi:hypothetical protein
VASEKLALVTVEGSSAWSKEAATATFGLTPVAPPAGNVETTPGAWGWCVVNVHENGAASGVPSTALTVAASVAV